MKKLVMVFLLCASTLAVQAETWSNLGKVWTSKEVEVTVPSQLKATQDSDGLLTAENDNLSVMLTPLAPDSEFEVFQKQITQELSKEFKGMKWSPVVSHREGSVTIQMREGKASQDGVQIGYTLAVVSKGKHRLGVMTVQKADDKASSTLTSQMMNSLVFK